MKINHLLGYLAIASLLFHSCSSNNDEIINSKTANITPTSVNLVVPIGCRSLIIKYKNSNDEIKTTEVPVDPKATVYKQHDVSSLTNLKLTFNSKNNAYIDIYDSNNNVLAQNVFVKASTTTSKANDTAITIPEDAVAKYVTSDGPQTFYHSSGVVMFDDSWPNNPVIGSVDADFNDVVIDYDIEAKTLDANTAPSQTWREQVKVVMHVRAIGGTYPQGVGLYLEGLSSKYIDNTSTKLTIGNYNTDEIPANSLNASVSSNGDHPKIQINNLGWLNSSEAQTTYYTNSKTGIKQLFNNRTYNKFQAEKYTYNNGTAPLFYNVNSGYINQGGDLFTLTVIFRYKDRTSMTETESAAQLSDMIEAVTNTEKQNFYIITNSKYEIHLKGYNPTPSYTTYTTDVAKSNVAMSSTATYCTNDGLVWGIKTPVLTGHVWERVSFYGVYAKYKSFIQSSGMQDKDWYIEDEAHINIPDNTKIVHDW